MAPTKRPPIFRNTSDQVKRDGAISAISEIGALPSNQSQSELTPRHETQPQDSPAPLQSSIYSPEDPIDYWQKITIAFRRDQVEALQKILRTWELNDGVTITFVEMARLATDEIIQAAATEKEPIWIKVKNQAEREYRENPKSKHSKSKALKIRIR